MLGLQEPHMWQALGTVQVFKEFLEKEHFERIVEIGTGNGHFTRALAEMFDGTIFTFDNRIWIDHPGGFKGRCYLPENVEEFLENVFDLDVIGFIGWIISEPGRVLLLCDGGDKPREMRTFCKYLKVNDVAMAHDLGRDVCDNYIPDVIYNYHLEPFYHEVFCYKHWMSKIRRERGHGGRNSA